MVAIIMPTEARSGILINSTSSSTILTTSAKATLRKRDARSARSRRSPQMLPKPVLAPADLPLNFHPVTIRDPAFDTPEGADVATGDRRSWSGLRSRSPVAVSLAAYSAGVA